MYKALINYSQWFDLAGWDAQGFNTSLTLTVESTDFAGIKEAFGNVEILNIYNKETLVATYTNLDTFSEITYVGKVFDPDRNRFVEAMTVHMTKTNLVKQVQRLDAQINPVVDPATMTMEELRHYKLGQISKACEADIYAGETIVLENGDRERFTFKAEDQIDLKALFDLIVANPDVDNLPYHQSGAGCKIYSRMDIIIIYTTLLLRLTKLVTYANQLNMYVRSISDRDVLMEIEYGTDLPEEYEQTFNMIMSVTIEQMQKIMAKIIPATPDTTEYSEEN